MSKELRSTSALSCLRCICVPVVRVSFLSVPWPPHLIKDIERLECVQRRFRLTWTSTWTVYTLTYKDRFRALGLQSLEAKRLQFDLIYDYKILTGKADVNIASSFIVQSYQSTRDHGYKLYLSGCRTHVGKFFFARPVIRPCNYFELTPESISSLRRTANLSQFLHYS